MKKTTKTFIAILSISIGTFIISDFLSPAHSNVSGAPAGRTGSPGDGLNCSNGCHTGVGNPSSNPGMITSNIPLGGYTPGVIYTITATALSAGPITPAKYGFEISPQNVAGTQKGTLIVTNSTETQLVGSGKYITHKGAGTAPVIGVKSWTFNWLAPATGQGPVTFYGAFVFANGDGNTSGDIVVLSTLTVKEASGVGINEVAYSPIDNWSVYPNPAINDIQINNSLLKEGQFDITIFDVTGKKVKEIKSYDIIQKSAIDITQLNKGIYLINIDTENTTITKKLVKK